MEGRTELVELPADVLGVIFSHAQIDYWDLASIALVSKDWLYTAFQVEQVDLVPFPRERDPNRWRNLRPSVDILSKLTRLRSFRVFRSVSFTESTLAALAKLKYLHSISFENASEDLTSTMVKEILSRLPQLRSFVLKKCDHIDSRILKPLMARKDLKKLVLWDNLFVRNYSDSPLIKQIAESLVNLERLEIAVVDATTSDCWKAISELKRLTHLKIKHTGEREISELMCDAQSLVELEIEGYFTLPRKGLSKMTNLKKLTINCTTDEDVFGGTTTAVEVPPALVELHLFQCCLSAPVSIAALAPSIQIITMRPCNHYEISQLVHFKGLPHLRKLGLQVFSYYRQISEKNDNIIKELGPIFEWL